MARQKKTLDLEALDRLSDQIGADIDGDRLGLIHRLETEEGLKLSWRGGAMQARLAGITASSTEGERGALINWTNAVRRARLASGKA